MKYIFKEQLYITKNRLNFIDQYRFIANLMVMIVHYPKFVNIFSGYLGVEMFSIISGFVIFTMYSKHETGVLNFIKKRIVRIYSGAAVLIIIALLKHGTFDWRLPLFPSSDISNHAWTLSNEIILYLISPLLFINLKRSLIVSSVLYSAFLIYVSLTIQITDFCGGVDRWQPGFWISFPRMLFPFTLGAFIASKKSYDLPNLKYFNVIKSGGFVCIMFILSSIFRAKKLLILNIAPDVLFTLSFALLILHKNSTINESKSKINSAISLLGRISYSSYLFHSIILQLINKIIPMSFIGFAVYFIFTIIVSIINYNLFEQKFYKICCNYLKIGS